MTLTVVDARCGNKNDKVLVCHNGQALCIAATAVSAHFANHQDQLGSCATAARPAAGSAPVAGASLLEAFPNPFSGSAMLRFRAMAAGAAQVRVYNSMGQQVATLYDQQTQEGQVVELMLNGEKLASGLYTCQLRLNNAVETIRLVLVK